MAQQATSPETRRKLVLHFDVNETIMVGDPAGGDTFEDCVNKMISKNALVRKLSADAATPGPLGDYAWLDGTPLDPTLRASPQASAPPLSTAWAWSEGCVPFYRVPHLKDAYAKAFTSPHSPGAVYRPVFDAIEVAMRLPASETPIDPRLVAEDGVHYRVVPSFFATLQALVGGGSSADPEWGGREFGLVLRTFGSDGPDISDAIAAWAEGAHPEYAGLPAASPAARCSFWVGRFGRDGGGMGAFELSGVPRKACPEASAKSASGFAGATRLDEAGAVALVAQGALGGTAAAAPSWLCLQDDYAWWRDGGCRPSRGKPLWFSPHDDRHHPIFFDDNIHNDASDSIVAVRVNDGPGAPFRAVSGEATRQLQGLLLVRVPTPDAVLDRQWFLTRVRDCERNFAASSAEQRQAILDAA